MIGEGNTCASGAILVRMIVSFVENKTYFRLRLFRLCRLVKDQASAVRWFVTLL